MSIASSKRGRSIARFANEWRTSANYQLRRPNSISCLLVRIEVLSRLENADRAKRPDDRAAIGHVSTVFGQDERLEKEAAR